MNIFFLDKDPVLAAQYLVDKHVVKMITESRQMLDVAHNLATGYKNHPCTIWARTNTANYKWLLEHALAIGAEYIYRYDRIHKSELYIREHHMNIPDLPFAESISFPALAMPEQYHSKDYVESYRNYYRFEKLHLFKWKKRERPLWI